MVDYFFHTTQHHLRILLLQLSWPKLENYNVIYEVFVFLFRLIFKYKATNDLAVRREGKDTLCSWFCSQVFHNPYVSFS